MKSETKLKKSWIWNNEVSEFVRNFINEEDYVLNIPCGNSDIGNVLADIDPINKNIEKVDMNDLPYEDNKFDIVIQDPPWKIGFYKRFKPFFECVRVCKVGGNIIYNAYWIPNSDFVKLINTYIRQDNNFTNTSIISIFKKVKDLNG